MSGKQPPSCSFTPACRARLIEERETNERLSLSHTLLFACLQDMASALADFAVVSHPAFGVLAIHSHDETQCATVSDFKLPPKRRSSSGAAAGFAAAAGGAGAGGAIGVVSGEGTQALLPVRLQACSAGVGLP